ncbi:cytochrome p450 monooxygenase GliC [Melanomma pulvis-pyrius CBS 109.77]|uniref:Cytochrome p450 monooxygenase GliC n=1 Tax=Melanomma pulvis-pyrius CBS 109.77 TaxID=1314802 RepID=A0A6A6XH31_9PLEO|nr:cytochrome p450 monooxygenase GliC [Melanomma pulvis-pyrius CBS 109.77]
MADQAFYVAVLFAIPVVLLVSGCRSFLLKFAVGTLSKIIDTYLLLKHPLLHSDRSQQRPIPTCPYSFPNGQGDVAKFLEGENNSESWAKEHGRIYRIWSGTTPEIVLTRSEDIKTICRDSNSHLKATNNDGGWLMGQMLGSCLGLVSGDEWQRIKSAVSRTFAKGEVAGQIEIIEDLTREHFKALHQHGRLDTGILNPVADLRMLPFWIVADHLYGALAPAMKNQLTQLIPGREALFVRCIQGGVTRFGWSRFLPTKTNRELQIFKRQWHDFNDTVFHACEAEGRTPPIVEMYQAVRSGHITSENMYQTLDEMLFANLDVTMGAISWNLVFLAINEDVQERVRVEIREARNLDDSKKWLEYLLSPSTLLASSILESARLKPLAAFTVPQAAPKGQVLGGFPIPPRTNFVIDTYAINIRNNYWGEDTQAYRPDRFMRKKASATRYHYWRFGFGPRQCLGKYLAESMIRVLLVHFLENYALSLQEDSNMDRDPGSWITHPNLELICKAISEPYRVN